MQNEMNEARGSLEGLSEEVWSRVDIAWEKAQLRGLERFRAHDLAGAGRAWEEAYEIACRHLEPSDPRRAASYTSHAYVLMRRGEVARAQLLLQDALAIWEESWFWVLYMRPEPGPDGGRAERYDREQRAAFEQLAARGHAVTEALIESRRLPHQDGLALWARERPNVGCDRRKLMAAVLLIASRADRRQAASTRAA
jgi:hypothetical protein